MDIPTVFMDKLNYCSLDYILENFEKLNFIKISTRTSIILPTENGDYNLDYTNEENPIGIGVTVRDSSDALYINKDYYLKNKEEIDEKLYSIISKFREKEDSYTDLIIDGENLINEKVIDAIANNKKLSKVSLRDFENGGYDLTGEVYEKLKESGHITKIDTSGVANELKENFDSMIKCNYDQPIFSKYSYEQLQTLNKIYINEWDNNKQDSIKYIKYINPDCEISINIKDNQELQSFIQALTNANININNKTTMTISDKIFFNNNLFKYFNESNSENIMLKVPTGEYNLKEYIGYETRLNKLVENAMDLSPLERYVYAYNVVKNFKPYKENEQEKNLSRNIYSILDNEYMVCVGYAEMLSDLLTRLGLSSMKISEEVNIGFDGLAQDSLEVGNHEAKSAGHARVMVKIDDPKYNVKGIYYADPTWDNNLNADFYNHILMTGLEYNSQSRENFHSYFNMHELFEADSIEEFYSRVNYYLAKINKKEGNYNLKSDINQYPQTMQELAKKGINSYDLLKTINDVIAIDYDKGSHNFYIGRYDRANTIKHVVTNIKDKLTQNISNDELKELVLESLNSLNRKEHHLKDEGQIQVCRVLNDYIKVFNPELYEKVSNTNPKAVLEPGELNNQQFASYIEEVGSFITSMNNNKVKGSTILEAVKEVYKANNVENIDEKLEKVQRQNESLYTTNYPERLKITSDNEEVYMNEENKFSEDAMTR